MIDHTHEPTDGERELGRRLKRDITRETMTHGGQFRPAPGRAVKRARKRQRQARRLNRSA